MHVGSNVLTEKKSGTVSVMNNGSVAAKGPALQELCGSGAFIGRRAAAAGSRGLGACLGILARVPSRWWWQGPLSLWCEGC